MKCRLHWERTAERLTLAGVPSIEYPVIIRPFRASGAQSSNSSRLGPTCMKPGLARTTQGGPSAIFFSQPLVWGTFEMCLGWRLAIAYRAATYYSHTWKQKDCLFGQTVTGCWRSSYGYMSGKLPYTSLQALTHNKQVHCANLDASSSIRLRSTAVLGLFRAQMWAKGHGHLAEWLNEPDSWT